MKMTAYLFCIKLETKFILMSNIYIYIYIYIYGLYTHFGDDILKRAWALFCTQLNGFKYCYIKLTLATLVVGDPTTLFFNSFYTEVLGRRYSIPRIAPLCPLSLPFNAVCKAKQHQVPYFSLWYDSTWDWLNSGLPDQWQTLYSLSQWPRFANSHLLSHSFFIWPMNRTLSGITTPGQSGPGSNGNEEVLHIRQISEPGASPLDGLMLYSGHSLGRRSYPSIEMQSVYCTAPAYWVPI